MSKELESLFNSSDKDCALQFFNGSVFNSSIFNTSHLNQTTRDELKREVDKIRRDFAAAGKKWEAQFKKGLAKGLIDSGIEGLKPGADDGADDGGGGCDIACSFSSKLVGGKRVESVACSIDGVAKPEAKSCDECACDD